MEAIIYVAHGSRREAANEKFITFIRDVMKIATTKIQEYGFLEHAEPSILQAIEACIQKGAQKITVVPVLLLPGVHANEDIPAEIRKAETKYSDIRFHYGGILGSDEAMVDILHERLILRGFSKMEDEAVLLVGHGSREPDAAVELQKLAKNLRDKIEWEVHTAYLTTHAFYDEKIEELLAEHYKKVYILPFFLFTGGFTVKMEKILLKVKDRLIFCDHIGFDERLIPLIQKRADLG